jgi:uncharacterized SAM-dependent methyltransferase
MFRPLLSPTSQTATNEDFSQDVRDFFGERRSGHLSRWLYATSHFAGDKADGAGAWTRVIDAAKKGSPYYVFQKERDIIQNFLPRVSRVINKDTRFVDLGPGSVDAVQQKVLPIIKHVNGLVKHYVAVDICSETLAGATAEVKNQFPFIDTQKIEQDFIQDSFFYGDGDIEQEVSALFGLTLCNMPIDPRVVMLPELFLISSFRRLKNHQKASENYLLITQDTNQDLDRLTAAYMALEEHYCSVLYRVKRDLRVEGDYEPENFKMGVDYFADTQACALYFETLKKMNFWIEGEQFVLAKGEKLYFHNAFKFDEKTFLTAAQKAGYESVLVEREVDNPCVLHVFKAA